jgi:hypothetical protein
MGAMLSRGWLLVGTAGVLVMVVASAWAPLQPELFHSGGACQKAPCGTLEDPERWRQAWWLWGVGALVAAVAAAFVLAPRRPDAQSVLLLGASAVMTVLPLPVFVLVLSLLTSVQGVATAAVLAPLLGVAVLGSWARALRRGW